jgi:hypothetical protein
LHPAHLSQELSLLCNHNELATLEERNEKRLDYFRRAGATMAGATTSKSTSNVSMASKKRTRPIERSKHQQLLSGEAGSS